MSQEGDKIRAELSRFAAAEALANATLAIYAAIKVTQSQQPALVMNALPALETALEGWSKVFEIQACPESEATTC